MEKNVRRLARLAASLGVLVCVASTAGAQTDGGADAAADATVDAAPIVPDGARPDYDELEDGGGRGWVCAAGPSGADTDAAVGVAIGIAATVIVTRRRARRARST